MKIATWNVKNFFDAGTYSDISGRLVVGERFVSERVRYFTEEIQKVDPDIIFLQEVQAEKALSELADTISMLYFQAKKDHRGIANAVLYKKSLEGVKAASLSLPPVSMPTLTGMSSEVLTLRREVVELSVSYLGKEITLLGVHLKSALPLFVEEQRKEGEYENASARSALYKIGEMLSLHAYAKKLSSEKKEVMIMGDFNESTNAATHGILRFTDFRKEMLVDVLASYERDKTTHYFYGNKVTLDTIYMTPYMERQVISRGIENGVLRDMTEDAIDAQSKESDHALVWVELRG